MSMDRDPNVYDRDTRGSNTLAYLIGGLVLALGLLAFLFYDGGDRDVSTTSSTGTQTEQSGSATPATPAPPADSATSPAAPTTPARPTQP